MLSAADTKYRSRESNGRRWEYDPFAESKFHTEFYSHRRDPLHAYVTCTPCTPRASLAKSLTKSISLSARPPHQRKTTKQLGTPTADSQELARRSLCSPEQLRAAAERERERQVVAGFADGVQLVMPREAPQEGDLRGDSRGAIKLRLHLGRN